MSRFHIANNGQPAKCNATTRACPLGGEHFDSQREAMEHLNAQEFGPAPVAQPAPSTPRAEFLANRVGRANAQQAAFVARVLAE